MEIKIEYPVRVVQAANHTLIADANDKIVVPDMIATLLNTAHASQTRQSTQSCPVCVANEPVIRGMRGALTDISIKAEIGFQSSDVEQLNVIHKRAEAALAAAGGAV